jgi:hypothetical protein
MYAVRHHGNAVGLINYSTDLIIQKYYTRLPASATWTNTGALNIIPAAMFISDAINVMLIHPDEYPMEKSQTNEKSNEDEKIHSPNDDEKKKQELIKIKKIKDSIYKTGMEIASSLSSINAGGSSDYTLYGPNDIIHALGLFHDHFYPSLHLLQLQLTHFHSIFRISDYLLLYD